MFRKYLEWDPKRFEKARKEGKIDKRPNEQKQKEELPDFVWEYIWESELDDLKRAVTKNPNRFPADHRGIIYNNNLYIVQDYDFVHDHLVIYLMDNHGLKINKEMLDKWHLPLYCTESNFLCLQSWGNDSVYLSESYSSRAINEIKETNYANKFKPVLKKIKANLVLAN